MILRNFFHCGHLLFTWKTHCGLKFHFCQFDWSEICTKVSFTLPEVMWMLIMKLPHTKVKFYSEVKPLTGLSSLWISCKHAQKKQSPSKLLCIKEKLNLCDIWKIQNPKAKHYTFRQHHFSGFIQRCLDYIFISKQTEILNSISKDHSPVLCSFQNFNQF